MLLPWQRLCIWVVLTGSALSFFALEEKQEQITKSSELQFVQRLGKTEEKLPADYRAQDGSYFLSLPPLYNPARAYPLMIAVASSDIGSYMFKVWEKTAKRYGFLFACANHAGDQLPFAMRGQRALDVIADVQEKYKIDSERIFIVGHGRGGKVAAAVTYTMPNFFAGLIAMEGFVFPELRDFKRLNTKLGIYIYSGELALDRTECEQAYEKLKTLDQPVKFYLAKGKGQDLPDADLCGKIYAWFLSQKKILGK